MKLRLISFLSIALLFVGCGDEPKEVQTPKEKVKVVKTFKVKDGNTYTRTRNYPAVIYSLQDSTMAFEVAGKITKFNYNEGDFIKKGEVIASLDDTIYKANYNSALANYKQAQLDFNRYKKLFESAAIAKRDFEQRRQNLDVTKSNLEIAKKNLAETKLIAEFDGVLARKLINDYARINSKEPIIRLQDNSAYKVKFFVPESHILEVQKEISEENATDMIDFFVTIGEYKKRIVAKMLDISTTAEEISRTFEVTLKIDPIKNKNILPGMTASVEATDKKMHSTKFYVPLKAIFSDATKKSFVWIIDNSNKVHKQEVTTGRLREDSIEIKSGLNKDAKIVISGIRFLNENDTIKEYIKIGN